MLAERVLTTETIRTDRLKLEPLKVSHAPDLFPLLDDWMIVRMLAEVPWPLALHDVEDYAARQRRPARESDDFAIFLGPFAIGVCGVKRPGTGVPRRTMPRLGYWIARRYWGKGYATEAVAALVDYARARFDTEKIGAGVFADNPGSRRVLEKLGFSTVGFYTLRCLSRQAFVAVEDMHLPVAAMAAAEAAEG